MTEKPQNSQAGFTLLEVILTIAILLSLSISATNNISNSIDLKVGLAEQFDISHRGNMIIQRMTQDLNHVFIVPRTRPEYNFIDRRTKSIFKVDRGTKLSMTTMSRRPIKRNSPESDQTFIIYELRDDPDIPGLKALFRGESEVIPEKFSDDLNMVKMSGGIKKFQVFPWTGQRWSSENWDTDKAEHRDMLPRMVKILVEIVEDEEEAKDNVAEAPSLTFASVVYLPRSWGFKEYKPYSGSIKWN